MAHHVLQEDAEFTLLPREVLTHGHHYVRLAQRQLGVLEYVTALIVPRVVFRHEDKENRAVDQGSGQRIWCVFTGWLRVPTANENLSVTGIQYKILII